MSRLLFPIQKRGFSGSCVRIRPLCHFRHTSLREYNEIGIGKGPPSFASRPMPEFPDITVYIERLRPRIQGQVLEKVQIASPFLLRSVEPPVSATEGRRIIDLLRLGKRIVWSFDDDLYLVLHLMIAGRLHWKPAGAKLPGKVGLAAFRFPNGTLTLTEAGSKKRASLHVVRGRRALKSMIRQGSTCCRPG